jgi:hypothetical protein
MNVTVNITEGKCPSVTKPVTVSDAGPPLDDTVCVPLPPPTGNWHLSAVNGQITTNPPAWVQD